MKPSYSLFIQFPLLVQNWCICGFRSWRNFFDSLVIINNGPIKFIIGIMHVYLFLLAAVEVITTLRKAHIQNSWLELLLDIIEEFIGMLLRLLFLLHSTLLRPLSVMECVSCLWSLARPTPMSPLLIFLRTTLYRLLSLLTRHVPQFSCCWVVWIGADYRFLALLLAWPKYQVPRFLINPLIFIVILGGICRFTLITDGFEHFEWIVEYAD